MNNLCEAAGELMAEFQITRRGRQTSRGRTKVFTFDEAQRALPLVRRIVTDVVAQYRRLERLQQRRRRLKAQNRKRIVAELDDQAAQGADRLIELINEVNDIGCELKDWENGLVDFRTHHDGRDVYLCWKLGEDGLAHWHELHAGDGARRPVDPSFR